MPQGIIGKKRMVVGPWLLAIVTLGIYGLVWWYKINNELKKFDSRIDVNPTMSVLAFLPGAFILVPPFVSVFKTGKRIRQAQEAAGLQPSCSPGLGLLLAFIYSTYQIYYTVELNKIWDSYPGATEGTVVPHRGAGAPQYAG